MKATAVLAGWGDWLPSSSLLAFASHPIDTSTQHVQADEAKLSPLHAAVMGDIQTATRIDSKADIEIQAPARAV